MDYTLLIVAQALIGLLALAALAFAIMAWRRMHHQPATSTATSNQPDHLTRDKTL